MNQPKKPKKPRNSKDPNTNWYGVHKGRKRGAFKNWTDAEQAVKGYSGAKFKKFKTRAEAEQFAETGAAETGATEIEAAETGAAETIDSIKVMRIFTDGSHSAKTHRSGLGVSFASPHQALIISKVLPLNTTNQCAELEAISAALWTIEHRMKGEKRPIEIWSDSDYSCKCMKVWVKRWQRNGWRTAGNRPVKHRRKIEECSILYEALCHRVKLRHISEVGITSHQSRASIVGGSTLQKIVWQGNQCADMLAKGK